DRKTEIKADDHLTVANNQHIKLGTAHLLAAGREIHLKAGQKMVIEAGMEITLKAGGRFIKIDPSGVTLVGPQVRMSSCGSPANCSGVSALLPTIAGAADSDTAGKITQWPLANSPERLVAAAKDNLLLSSQCQRQPDGNCSLEACPCLSN